MLTPTKIRLLFQRLLRLAANASLYAVSILIVVAKVLPVIEFALGYLA